MPRARRPEATARVVAGCALAAAVPMRIRLDAGKGRRVKRRCLRCAAKGVLRPCPCSHGMVHTAGMAATADRSGAVGDGERSTVAKRRYMDLRRGRIRAEKYSAGARNNYWGSGRDRRVKPRPEEAGGGAGRVGTAATAGGEKGASTKAECIRERRLRDAHRTASSDGPPGTGRRKPGEGRGFTRRGAAPRKRSAGASEAGAASASGRARRVARPRAPCARARVVAGWTRLRRDRNAKGATGAGGAGLADPARSGNTARKRVTITGEGCEAVRL
jgi:hypothetical protein